MNEELKDLVEDIEVKEEKVQEEEVKILEKITGIQIEDKKVEALRGYLKANGVDLAFQAIFTEIITKKIEKEQVFAYAAMRLRQIGNDLNVLKKKDAKI